MSLGSTFIQEYDLQGLVPGQDYQVDVTAFYTDDGESEPATLSQPKAPAMLAAAARARCLAVSSRVSVRVIRDIVDETLVALPAAARDLQPCLQPDEASPEGCGGRSRNVVKVRMGAWL